MKKKITLLLVVLLLISLITACGTPSIPEQNEADGELPTVKRDSVNLSINQAWTTCDPHSTTYVQDRLILWQMYEGLMFYNELTGEAEPHLAKSYDVSEDGITYTFHLRDNVYFHNGDQMKASDVAFSIMRATNPDKAISMYGTNIESAKAIDDVTVEIKLSTSYAPFLVNACQLFVISEREVTEQGEKFGTIVSSAGTGPYQLTHMDSDEKIVLTAFDKYYKGEASIKNVNFYPITDSAAGVVAFESGDLDWFNCTVSDYTRLKDSGKFDAEAMTANHMTFVAINPNSSNEALKNEKVRQAIAYAINKKEMNHAAFDGLGLEADYLENPDYNVGAPKGDIIYNYDLDRAKALLSEAGYPNGVDVGNILCFTGSHFEICATVLQAQLSAAGINAELEWAEQATTLNRGKAKDYDILMTGGNCSGDYDNLRKRFYSPLSTTYVEYAKTEYGSEWLDTMIDKASSTVDAKERLALNKEINDYLMKTATYLPLLHKCVPYVWTKDLKLVNRPVNYLVYEWSWK